jgi:iron(III) transport system permease protein
MSVGVLAARVRRLPGWAALVAVGAVAAAPVAVILWSVVDPDTAVWRQQWDTRLPGMLRDTATLLVAVLAGTLALGTGLAWLVTAHDFPGRRVVGWLLVAPLAVPGYVLGFVWLDTLAGPLGARGVRSIWVCAAVLTLTLYPYVYLFARAAFREQAASAVAAARSLGCSPFAAFRRVTLPMARPSLAAGAALVAMEVLTDIGTVRLYNVGTLADGVLRIWFGTGKRDAAAELAVLLVGTAVGLIAVERSLRGRARFTQHATGPAPTPRRLGAGAAATVFLGATAVLAAAVVVPVVRLAGWAAEAQRSGDAVTVAGGLVFHLANTVRLAAVATALCLTVGTAMALAVRRRGSAGRAVGRLSALGYAVPGPVVAIGVVIVLAAVDRRNLLPGGTLLVGSFAGLVYALSTRFLAIGYQGVEASLAKVPERAVASARTLGAGPWRVATRVELPLARAGLLAAAALVAVDSVKELPITLLLRPFGGETLSVWVWQATSESLWEQAAVPSLAMVAVAMAPVAALLWALERGAEVVS